MWLAKLAVVLVMAYAAVISALYLAQTGLIFPTWLVPASGAPLPEGTRRLDVAAADGRRLKGVLIPGARRPDRGGIAVLGFGGNAWNAESLAVFLHGLYPRADVAAFHYRGYAPSEGRPSAAALLADAPIVHDEVAKELGRVPIVAVGVSLGAGPAAHLARRRPLAGLILVSPFDSLAALGRDHYPWIPVRRLLRHRMETADDLRGLAVPVAVIAAGDDTIVPAARTEPVRRAIGNLVLDRTIAGTGHNDIYGHPQFRAAMVEALERVERAAGP